VSHQRQKVGEPVSFRLQNNDPDRESPDLLLEDEVLINRDKTSKWPGRLR